jgi:hypothetical protein
MATTAAVAGAAGVKGSIFALGATVVAHSSGAAILTGSSGYIAGSMGLAGSISLVTGAALLAVGGGAIMEVSCLDLNHPAAAQRARDFYYDSPYRVRQAADDARTYVLKKLSN